MNINEGEVELFFKSLKNSSKVINEYKKYWDSVTPQNKEDIFRRYLFAFCSVHTNWKNNISGYNSIKNIDDWINNKDILYNKIKNSGMGMYNGRTENIWTFSTMYWISPDNYTLKNIDHVIKRNNLVNEIKGLGHAKVSFSLEMIHPNDAKVICGDVHQLRLYGVEGLNYKTKKGYSIYEKMESHWNDMCEKYKIPSYIARCIYWDKLQKQNDSRYWSHVLET